MLLFKVTVPAPPLAPAENCRPDVPLITPFIVISKPLVAPIQVVREELFVMFPFTTAPEAVATYPPSPVPVALTILVGTFTEPLATAMLILAAAAVPCWLPKIVTDAVPVPLTDSKAITPFAVLPAFGASTNSLLAPRVIGPDKPYCVEDTV